jgi:hypothetical protein
MGKLSNSCQTFTQMFVKNTIQFQKNTKCKHNDKLTQEAPLKLTFLA